MIPWVRLEFPAHAGVAAFCRLILFHPPKTSHPSTISVNCIALLAISYYFCRRFLLGLVQSSKLCVCVSMATSTENFFFLKKKVILAMGPHVYPRNLVDRKMHHHEIGNATFFLLSCNELLGKKSREFR